MSQQSEDTVRELHKIMDTLTSVAIHLHSKDAMNAALHMSTSIRSTPLASAVDNAAATVANLISELTDGSKNAASG